MAFSSFFPGLFPSSGHHGHRHSQKQTGFVDGEAEDEKRLVRRGTAPHEALRGVSSPLPIPSSPPWSLPWGCWETPSSYQTPSSYHPHGQTPRAAFLEGNVADPPGSHPLKQGDFRATAQLSHPLQLRNQNQAPCFPYPLFPIKKRAFKPKLLMSIFSSSHQAPFPFQQLTSFRQSFTTGSQEANQK